MKAAYNGIAVIRYMRTKVVSLDATQQLSPAWTSSAFVWKRWSRLISSLAVIALHPNSSCFAPLFKAFCTDDFSQHCCGHGIAVPEDAHSRLGVKVRSLPITDHNVTILPLTAVTNEVGSWRNGDGRSEADYEIGVSSLRLRRSDDFFLEIIAEIDDRVDEKAATFLEMVQQICSFFQI